MKRFPRFAPAILCFVGFVAAFGSACSTQTAKPPAPAAEELKTPTKDILLTTGDLNKQYDILGSVEATLTGQSMYATENTGGGGASPEVVQAVKDLLKKVAYAKYGERVDAIINFKAEGGTEGGFGGMFVGQFGAKTGIVHAEGIAVSFKKEAEAPSPAPANSTTKKKQKSP
jgi:hypothetical protein